MIIIVCANLLCCSERIDKGKVEDRLVEERTEISSTFIITINLYDHNHVDGDDDNDNDDDHDDEDYH